MFLLLIYDGDSFVFYWGENKDRFDKGFIGFCWIMDILVVEKFGCGLNVYKLLGLLLRVEVLVCFILVGFNVYSCYFGENEFMVNFLCFLNIIVIEIYLDNFFFK